MKQLSIITCVLCSLAVIVACLGSHQETRRVGRRAASGSIDGGAISSSSVAHSVVGSQAFVGEEWLEINDEKWIREDVIASIDRTKAGFVEMTVNGWKDGWGASLFWLHLRWPSGGQAISPDDIDIRIGYEDHVALEGEGFRVRLLQTSGQATLFCDGGLESAAQIGLDVDLVGNAPDGYSVRLRCRVSPQRKWFVRE